MKGTFKDPPKSARPLVRWWWPGMDVERDELLNEIRELDEKGFYGAEIQVFNFGLPKEIEDSDRERFERCHRYFQPFYYEMVKAVMDECEKRGMIIDLTICSSWPAGGTHIAKEQSLQMMLPGTAEVKGGRHYCGPIPRFIEPFQYGDNNKSFQMGLGVSKPLMEFWPGDMKLARVVAARAIGRTGDFSYKPDEPILLDIKSLVDLTDRVKDGNIEWDVPEGKWQLFAFYSGPTGTSPVVDSKEDPDKRSLVIDHFSAGVMKDFLEYHFGRGKKYFGKHFGKTFRAFFTDSLELMSECIWTQGFLEQFQKRRGYDLSPYLPVIFMPYKDNSYKNNQLASFKPCFDFAGDIGRRIRYDVQQTISDLFIEEFTVTMAKWAKENKLQSRIQAYGIRADTLLAYGKSDIPETESLYAGGTIDFFKFAGSAGIIYGKPVVTAEFSSWNRRDFMTTPLKIKVTADRMLVSGINQMIFHGYPYQNPVYTYPGYRPFSMASLNPNLNFSSYYCRNNPFWTHFSKVAGYIARCQFVLRQGRTRCNTAIFYNYFDYNNIVSKYEEMVYGYLDENDAPLPEDARKHFEYITDDIRDEDENLINIRRQVILGDNLMANGYYYVYVNEDRLLNSSVKDEKLVIGDAEAEVLIFSNTVGISLPLVERLKEIAALGVKILFIDKIPDKQNGYHDYIENERKIKCIVDELVRNSDCFIKLEDNPARHIRSKYGIMPDLVYENETGDIHYIRKIIGDRDYYFIRHGRNYPCRLPVRFPFKDKIPYILDLWMGEICEASQYRIEEGFLEMDLYLEAYGSILLEFRPSIPSLHAVESPMEVQRSGSSLVVFIEEKGKYGYKLSDGTHREIDIKEKAPDGMTIERWSLESEFRDNDGNTCMVGLELQGLKDWREIPELKYNSGTGVYRSKVFIGKPYLDARLALFLELGMVHDTAAVRINGQDAGYMMVFPYTMDISKYLKEGCNEIEITVTTTLRNRLIGYGETGDPRYRNYKGRELMPGGLIGPVKIIPKWMVEI